MNDLQALEHKMLSECVSVWERQGLRYFLLGGSALGAVRHEGFIPWDDDIDVGMPRPDYEAFMASASKALPSWLHLQSTASEPAYPLPYAKVRASATTYVESSLNHLPINHGVYIDVFPLDGYRDGAGRWRWALAGFVRNLSYWSTGVRHGLRPKGIRSAAMWALAGLLRWTGAVTSLRAWHENLLRSAPYDSCTWVVNWWGAWGVREAVPRAVFGRGKQALFNGMRTIIPEDCDAYLTSLYGDYMTPPPPEGRRTRHTTVEVDLGVAKRAWVDPRR